MPRMRGSVAAMPATHAASSAAWAGSVSHWTKTIASTSVPAVAAS